jgi:hypothetical protein
MGRLFVILLILVLPLRGWSAQQMAIQMIPSPLAAATAGIQAMRADCPMIAQPASETEKSPSSSNPAPTAQVRPLHAGY